MLIILLDIFHFRESNSIVSCYSIAPGLPHVSQRSQYRAIKSICVYCDATRRPDCDERNKMLLMPLSPCSDEVTSRDSFSCACMKRRVDAQFMDEISLRMGYSWSCDCFTCLTGALRMLALLRPIVIIDVIIISFVIIFHANASKSVQRSNNSKCQGSHQSS